MFPEKFVYKEKCHLSRKILFTSFIKKNLEVSQNQNSFSEKSSSRYKIILSYANQTKVIFL